MRITSNPTINRSDRTLESYIHRVALLQPIYELGGGDMTRVVLEDGESWVDPRPVTVVLKGIARWFGVDLTALRERYGEILGRKLNVPLPLSPKLVLLPLKMRTPLVQKDGTTGYVVTRLVERIVPVAGPGCNVELAGGLRIDCLQSPEHALQQWRNARIVQTFYRDSLQLGVTIER